MTEYVVRLIVLLPLVCGLIVAALWFGRKFMNRPMGLGLGQRAPRSVKLAEALFLSPGNRLAVVDFEDRRLLLAVSKAGVTLLTETAAPSFEVPDAG